MGNLSAKAMAAILNKLVQHVLPEEDITIEAIGGRIFKVQHNSVGCNWYKLKGEYTYDQVMHLNSLDPKGVVNFFFSKDTGPVAFICQNNAVYTTYTEGHFNSGVSAYGHPSVETNYKLKAYTEDEAKQIGNFTVYGQNAYNEVAKEAPIELISFISDYRHRVKCSKVKKIISMDAKLKGTYTFEEARILATGTAEDKEWFNGEDHPIVFAQLEDGTYVGIIDTGFMSWGTHEEYVGGFRDVWEYGKEKPESQGIRFIDKEEAMKVPEYVLYVYSMERPGIGRIKYPVEKQERTLDPRFDFRLEGGGDYRLVPHTEDFLEDKPEEEWK